MTPTHAKYFDSAAGVQRRKICRALALLSLGSCTAAWAQTETAARPALERFIQIAKLPQLARLWAQGFLTIAKLPSHPLHKLVTQIHGANESNVMALLVQTFQDLSDDNATQLIELLNTPLGQWVVQASLWGRENDLAQKPENNINPEKVAQNKMRRLTNTEIRAIKAMGRTPQWQALRSASNSTLLGGELLMALDWPVFVDLLLDPSQP